MKRADKKRELSNKPRSAALAVLFSLIRPGLGQMYCARVGLGLVYFLVFVVFDLLALVLLFSFKGFIAWLVIVLAFYAFVALDAYRRAKAAESLELRFYNAWYYYLLAALVLFVISNASAMLIRSQIEAFRIPSSAMEPAILRGDNIFVENISDYRPKRKDIVVFVLPEAQANAEEEDSQPLLIKRVIGLPGETIEIKGAQVYINGKKLDEPYARWNAGAGGDFGPLDIPEQSVFVLGDNRSQSRDSRHYAEPFIPTEQIAGRALYFYWSDLDRGRIGKAVQ